MLVEKLCAKFGCDMLRNNKFRPTSTSLTSYYHTTIGNMKLNSLKSNRFECPVNDHEYICITYVNIHTDLYINIYHILSTN